MGVAVQRRSLLLARALLADPPVLVLDEADRRRIPRRRGPRGDRLLPDPEDRATRYASEPACGERNPGVPLIRLNCERRTLGPHRRLRP